MTEISQCNPGLSELIHQTLQIPKAEFLKDLSKLEGLLKYVDNPSFQKKWAAVKQSNKERLAKHVEATLGLKVNTRAMFDVQIKVCALPPLGWGNRKLTISCRLASARVQGMLGRGRAVLELDLRRSTRSVKL